MIRKKHFIILAMILATVILGGCAPESTGDPLAVMPFHNQMNACGYPLSTSVKEMPC